MKTVENLTVRTLNDSVLIAWESPAEQSLCTASYIVSLISTASFTGKEVQITESSRHTMIALEPCVTYYANVWAIDFLGRKGNSVPFNVTADDRSVYLFLLFFLLKVKAKVISLLRLGVYEVVRGEIH